MRRIMLVLSVIALLGCGSDVTAPQDSFAGTWVGATHGLNFTIVAAQSGNSVSGTGMWIADSGGDLSFTISGTATPLHFTMRSTGGNNPQYYEGTYVTPDSVSGTVFNSSDNFAELSLTKQ